MGATEKQFDKIGIEAGLKPYQNTIMRTLGNPLELLYSYDAYQFTDYEKYESSMFSEEEKAKHKDKQFPIDCQKAFNMGAALVTND